MWTPKYEVSFLTLKQKLISALILQYPDLTKEYQLKTDASNKAIRAVLQIHTPDGFLPVDYKSQMLTPSEQNYLIHNKELFAVVHALKKWCAYLEGFDKVTVLTDHKSLEFFKISPNSQENKLVR